jgi:hypothetical protein
MVLKPEGIAVYKANRVGVAIMGIRGDELVVIFRSDPLCFPCRAAFGILASPLTSGSATPGQEENMFVLYRKGYEIFGVGETPGDAKRDAGEWLDDGMEEAETAEMAEPDGGVIGGLYISKCTDRLASALKEDNGDLVFDWNEDGLLDIVEGEDIAD